MIATSDWQRSVQNLIAPWVPGDYVALGADGFGFSDTRAAARRHFLIDGPSMVVATLAALERRGEYREGAAAEAAAKYELHDVRAGTSGNAGGDSAEHGVCLLQRVAARSARAGESAAGPGTVVLRIATVDMPEVRAPNSSSTLVRDCATL